MGGADQLIRGLALQSLPLSRPAFCNAAIKENAQVALLSCAAIILPTVTGKACQAVCWGW